MINKDRMLCEGAERKVWQAKPGKALPLKALSKVKNIVGARAVIMLKA